MSSFPYDIKSIRKLFLNKNILWSEHAATRMINRGITKNDVADCILNGEIIETYANDKPLPSCLVMSLLKNGRPLHVVCSVDNEFVYIITAYIPSPLKWKDDFKVRKDDEI